jgi:hypothetical protein
MKRDRLRDDKEEIHNLDELIDARNPGTSHISRDIDALECDFEIPEDMDVDEALTFPHPHHEKSEHIELMDTPHEADMDEDWADQDVLPTDYAHGYSEATTTDVRDDLDEIAEDQVHTIDHPSLDEIGNKTPGETMPGVFTPDEEDSAER